MPMITSALLAILKIFELNILEVFSIFFSNTYGDRQPGLNSSQVYVVSLRGEY